MGGSGKRYPGPRIGQAKPLPPAAQLTRQAARAQGCQPAVDERTVGIMTVAVVIVLLVLLCGAAVFILWRQRRRGGGNGGGGKAQR